MLPRQEGSGVVVIINMLLGGGACVKRCPSHQKKHHHCKAGRCHLAVRRRLLRQWQMKRQQCYCAGNYLCKVLDSTMQVGRGRRRTR